MMIKRLLAVLFGGIAITLSAIAALEYTMPFDDVVDYAAIINYPAYTEAEALDFLTISSHPGVIKSIDWRDSLICDLNGTGYEEVDVYPTGMKNKKPKTSHPDLMVQAKDRPEGNDLAWRLDLLDSITNMGELGNSIWKYRVSMPWPTENAPCYGRHEITVETPVFGFEKIKVLGSPGFWLVGNGKAVTKD